AAISGRKTTATAKESAFHHVDVLDRYRAAVAEIKDRKSTRLNSSHLVISYAVFCLKKKKKNKKRMKKEKIKTKTKKNTNNKKKLHKGKTKGINKIHYIHYINSISNERTVYSDL